MVKVRNIGIVAGLVLGLGAATYFSKDEPQFKPEVRLSLDGLKSEAGIYCKDDSYEVADVIKMDGVIKRKGELLTKNNYDPSCIFINCRPNSSGYKLIWEENDCHQ